MLTTFDYGIIILYFIVMISIGIFSTKFTKTKEDYLVAGRRLGFPMFFGCMAALAIGGAATVGGAKLGYTFGISGIWLAGSLGLGLIALGFLVSSKLSKMKALSINEVIENNYGKSARIFSSLLTFVYTMMMSVVQVVSVGAIISGIMGWNTQVSMLVGGGIVIFYTFIGGMWSVSLTDIIQFVIKTLGIVILIPIFAIVKMGGIHHILASVPQSHLSITGIGYDSIVMYLLMYIPGLIIGQDIWQRIFTAKNGKIAKRGTILAGFYSMIYGAAAILLGMCVYIALPSLKDPQNAFVSGVSLFLPIGVKGFVIAAAMAATMSVASGSILASSTILYNDVYARFINKNPDEKKSIVINRLFACLIGIGVMVIAFLIQDVLTALDMAYAYLSGCVFVPVLAAFVLKKFSPKAGLVSLFLSTIVVSGTFFKYGVDSNYPIIFGIIVGLLSYIIVNSIDKNKVESAIDKEENIA
ncbi:sodium:solute symporter [Clostridium sp. AWRP]|uniref:sodium:solute symporter n=1 Tax=Clostridium sp. AWRP TaxID=2212991 RepID=UPI000FD717E0|nr:sodium:solute symporter [Clostridium sp. AWRP]AZV56380.1 sodium:solute symporter [Clostridium sp. AWRP]